jgi:hypothetical protein
MNSARIIGFMREAFFKLGAWLFLGFFLGTLFGCGSDPSKDPIIATSICKESEFIEELGGDPASFTFFDLNEPGCQVTAFCGFHVDDICALSVRPDSYYCPIYRIGSRWVSVCKPGQENNPDQP